MLQHRRRVGAPRHASWRCKRDAGFAPVMRTFAVYDQRGPRSDIPRQRVVSESIHVNVHGSAAVDERLLLKLLGRLSGLSQGRGPG